MPTVVELETLMTRFLGDNSDLLRKLKDVESELVLVNHLLDTTSRKGQQTFNSFSNALSGFSAEVTHTALSLVNLEGGLIGVSSRAVQLYADFQALKVSFGVLTRDTEIADKTLKDLYKFAADTPLTLNEVLESSKQMLAFGQSVDTLIPSMRMLGDVSSALGVPLKNLTYLYGTLRAQGRAMTVDLRQFANRGIPIYLELAKALKLVDQEATTISTGTRARIDKLTEEGQINFDIVEKAFQNMTKAGGQFAGIMEKQSKELKGLFNSMREEINMSLKDLGEIIEKELNLKGAVKDITNFAKMFRDLDKETKSNIVTTIAFASAVVALTGGVIASRVAFNLLSLSLGGYTASATAATVATSGLYALVAVGGGLLADQFSKAYAELQGYKTGLEDIDAKTQKITKSAGEMYENFIKVAKGFGPDEKRDFLAGRIKFAEESVKLYNAEIEKTRQALNDILKNNNVAELGLFKQGEIEDLRRALTTLRTGLKSTQDGIASLRAESNATVGGKEGNPKEFTELALAIQKQTREIGLNTVQKMLAKAQNDGLNQSEIEILKVLQATYERRKADNDRIEESKKVREDFKKSLDSSITSMESELEHLKDIDGQYKTRRFTQQAVELGLQKETDARLFQIKMLSDSIRWQKEENKLRDESKQILESLKSPLDKFNESQAQLTKMLEADLISYNQFNKAMDLANNRFLEATNSANAFKDALEGIDGVLSGSAAARGRISAYLDSLPGRIGQGGRNWGTFVAPMPRLGPIREDVPGPINPMENPELRDFGPAWRVNNQGKNEVVDLLKQIAAAAVKEATNQNIVLRPADIQR